MFTKGSSELVLPAVTDQVGDSAPTQKQRTNVQENEDLVLPASGSYAACRG